MKKFWRERKEILLVLVIGAAMFGFWKWVEYHHYNTPGHCGGKSGCGWGWCKYYDGSDYLHDFTSW